MTASSPAFFGSNPAEVRTDVPGAAPKGTRVLGARKTPAARCSTRWTTAADDGDRAR
jgi:hypothetical protein